MRSVELFSGAGGLAMGLARAGLLMTFRYIGSKSRLTNALAPYIESQKRWDGYFVGSILRHGSSSEIRSSPWLENMG